MHYIRPYTMLSQTGIASATTSSVVEIDQVYGFAVVATVSALAGGATAGTVSIQGSVDGETYVEVATQDLGAESYLWNLDAQHYLYVKVVVTPDAGTLTAVVKLTGKAY